MGNSDSTAEYDEEEGLENLREYDLSPVTRRMAHEGWENAEELEAHFRRYMKYVLENPETELSPNDELDEYWHTFILDTQEYHEFCDRVFDGYLHHIPAPLPEEE